MAVAYVRNVAAAAMGATAPVALTVAAAGTTVGDLVVVIGRALSSRTVTSVTDTRSNTWTVDHTYGVGAVGLSYASCVVAAGKQMVSGDTITVNFTSTAGTTYQAAAYEFSGQLVTGGAAVVDQAGDNNTATLSCTAVTSVGSTADGDLVLSAAAQNTAVGATFNITTPDANSGLAWVDLDFPVPVAEIDLAYQFATTGAQTFSAAWTISAGSAMSASIVTYKAALPAGAVAEPVVIRQAVKRAAYY